MLHHTGRFKIRRIVQARLFRISNQDARYTNAIYRFMREGAVKNRQNIAFFQRGCKMQCTYWGTRLSNCSSSKRGKKLLLALMKSFR